MYNKKNSIVYLILILFGTMSSSCSQSSPYDEIEPTKKVENETKIIAYLPAGMTSPFYSQVAQSAAPYGEKYGLKLEAQAPPAETDFNGQIAIFDNFISRNVEGILFCSIDSEVLIPAIRKANKAEIPLINFNSLTPYEGGEIDGYVGYNQYKAGFSAGQYAASLLEGEGKVYIIRGVQGFHDTLRSNGFYDALSNFPNIDVLGEKVGDWVRDKSIEVTTEAFNEHPDISIIVGMNDEMAIGASIAAKKLQKKIFTIGIDGNPVSLSEIEKGNLTATVAAFPEKIGEVVMEQMRKILEGQSIHKFLETPTVIVDINNLNAYKTGELWSEPKKSEPEMMD
jgi:ABC-type sugar transport system substrate-binding protein